MFSVSKILLLIGFRSKINGFRVGQVNHFVLKLKIL